MKLTDIAITQDWETDAEEPPTYIRLRNCPVTKTESISSRINIDIDESGHIVGIEIL